MSVFFSGYMCTGHKQDPCVAFLLFRATEHRQSEVFLCTCHSSIGGLRVHVYTRIHLFFWLWESYWMRKWFCNFKPGPFPELSLYPTAPSGVQLPLTPFGLTLGKDFSRLGLNHCKVLFTITGPSALRWCYTRRFAKTIFSATQRCNIVATLFRIVTILFQHCNAVLPWKSSLRIVPCNITFTVSNRGRRYSCEI